MGSTTALLRRVKESAAPAFIVATEKGIFHEMQRQSPEKELIGATGEDGCACNICPHMKRNTLENLYLCLKNLSPRIELPAGVLSGARKSLEKMFELGAA